MAADRRSRAALLAALSRSGADGAELAGLCREIAERLGLRAVALQTAQGPQFRWPPSDPPGGTPRWTWTPVLLGGEQVGRLGVDAGLLPRLGASRRELLQDVTDLLGPVLHAARLRRALEATQVRAREHAERIAATRRQAFAERDRERQELERDLHDGAQHHLVALRMGVGLLEIQLTDADPEATRSTLAHLGAGLEQAEQTLLSTAAGVCPAVLVEKGLVEALTIEFQDISGPAQIEVLTPTATGGRRFPLAVETAVYFTCLEAVNNARKHAPGARVKVSLSEGPEGLSFSVTDDGPGLDRPDPLDSFGLGNMRSRIVAAGGELRVGSALGAGTTVAGFIPIRDSL
jgi:signal transduction histidine kinase